MIELIVNTLLVISGLYLLGGLLFCLYFYFGGASKIDEATTGSPWHFKLIILPGVILFWMPLLVRKLKSEKS